MIKDISKIVGIAIFEKDHHDKKRLLSVLKVRIEKNNTKGEKSRTF